MSRVAFLISMMRLDFGLFQILTLLISNTNRLCLRAMLVSQRAKQGEHDSFNHFRVLQLSWLLNVEILLHQEMNAFS